MVRALVLLSLFLLARAANAAVLISEVQIAPTESRFIELYNNGSEAVDLTGYYIQRKTESGTSFSSLVTSTNFEGQQIGAGKYFVISRTNVSNTNLVVGNMTLTESNTIQLKNSSGEVIDKLCWGNAGDCGGAKLAPNPAEGKSTSLINGAFVEADPTIGGANTAITNTNIDNNVTTNTESSNSANPSNTPSGSTKEPTIQLSYTEPVFASIPTMFTVSSFGSTGDRYIYGKYIWNFGDGVSVESKASDTKDIAHTYFYPGDYILTLEYYGSDYALVPSLTWRKNISVLPVSIIISKIGDEADFSVELFNQTKSEVDISGWKLLHGMESFVLPRNTFLPAGKKVTFSPNVTQFNFNNADSIILYNKNGNPVFDSASLRPKNAVNSDTYVSSQKKTLSSLALAESADDVVDLTGEKLKITNLDSQDLLAKPQTQNQYVLKTLLILSLILLIGSVLVYFVRKSRRANTQAVDFEIIDE